MLEKSSRTPLTWAPGKKPIAMQGWLLNVASDKRVSCGALRTALVLSFGFNATNGGCWQTKSTMAKSAAVSTSSIKQGLAELETSGHILRIEEPIRGRPMRVIYPVLNSEIEQQEPRARRGGVSKGVNPKQRAAENAAREAGETKAENTAPAPAETHAVPASILMPEPAPSPVADATISAAVPVAASPEREEQPIDPEAGPAGNVMNERHPENGIPYHSVRQRMTMQGFRSRPGIRLTADDYKAGSQAWADGQFDSWAEHLTGEGPIHQSLTQTEGQSKPWAKGQPPCIQEKSKRIILDPIREGRTQPDQVVAGCSHGGCGSAARYRCPETGFAFCVRHRGNSYAAVEIHEGL
ncbi:hypothetical protein MKK88_07545 [Methylobacterium sp. E-005]|uniref:hypothetical protein n=1 Tax=Methylobacterium sp. E-005 TaxID=2836549 RepID=UPI001FBBB17A|nr:hypothetical protein [Methylobacterium sp. E-005]MCJ2085845.1 hypothetical protein [Methylobacterium sp. E-005]